MTHGPHRHLPLLPLHPLLEDGFVRIPPRVSSFSGRPAVHLRRRRRKTRASRSAGRDRRERRLHVGLPHWLTACCPCSCSQPSKRLQEAITSPLGLAYDKNKGLRRLHAVHAARQKVSSWIVDKIRDQATRRKTPPHRYGEEQLLSIRSGSMTIRLMRNCQRSVRAERSPASRELRRGWYILLREAVGRQGGLGIQVSNPRRNARLRFSIACPAATPAILDLGKQDV